MTLEHIKDIIPRTEEYKIYKSYKTCHGNLITEDGRECDTCNEMKPWESFVKNKNGVNWRLSKCRECIRKYRQENALMLNNKDKVRKSSIRAREKFREYRREYRRKNREQIRETNRRCRERNRKEINRKCREKERRLYLMGEYVVYCNEKCRILRDYDRKKWLLIRFRWMEVTTTKSRVKPWRKPKLF